MKVLNSHWIESCKRLNINSKTNCVKVVNLIFSKYNLFNIIFWHLNVNILKNIIVFLNRSMNNLQDCAFFFPLKYILIKKMHIKVEISSKFLIEHVKVKLCPIMFERTCVAWCLRCWHLFHKIMGPNLCKCVYAFCVCVYIHIIF